MALQVFGHIFTKIVWDGPIMLLPLIGPKRGDPGPLGHLGEKIKSLYFVLNYFKNIAGYIKVGFYSKSL